MDKIFIGMATFKSRESAVKKAIASLENQCDDIYLYDNNAPKNAGYDLTDNGKFFGINMFKGDFYYLTCDDDIAYPPNYVQDMIKFIDEHNCIATHHGRILQGLGRNYYRGHRSFRCLNDTPDGIVLDVPGTGVTGFHTSYFKPTELWKSNDLKMSDLVFALEAAKQKKIIKLMGHKTGYITGLDIDLRNTICATESPKCHRQNQIADEIWLLKNTI